ncbi:VCBS domain-containing protein [Vibrio fluvialis]|uniref:VCBS domain-containing protein n=1 Tax=Vibrio fluvialis TaxID=676 RepID=UPI00130260A0
MAKIHKTITITINGAADDSAITVGSGDSAAESVTEDENVTDGNLTTSGSLTVTDADGDGAFNTTPTFTSSTVEGGAQLGTLTIDAEGNWTYTVDNNNATVQGLNAGETIVETYTVATEDGKDTQTITITINGAADDSAITVGSGDSAAESVTEDENVTDGNLTTSGSLTVTDADGDGAFNTTPTFTSSTVEGGAQLGTLTIDAEGNWTYTVDNNNATVQGLNAGETIVETYTVATEDGKDTQTITITINGAADDSAITVGSGDSAAESVTEDENVTDGNLTTSGSLTVTDADGDGAFNTTPTFTSSTVEGGAQLGTLTIDAEGNWTYTVDNNNATVQGLNAGETIVETYTVCDGGWQRYTNHHDHHQWCGRRLSHHRGLWRQRGRERDRRRECDGWQSDHIRQLDRDRCGWRRRVQHHANVHKQHSGRRSSTGYVDHRCGRQLDVHSG